jgi:predicted transglutaminase-like cysteine proteinase
MRQIFGHQKARVLSRTVPGLCVALGIALMGATVHTQSALSQTSTSSVAVTVAPAQVSIAHHDAKPTKGWVRFCQQRPEECAVDLSEPDTIKLTAKAWQTFVHVNRQVNGAIKPATDQEHWGEEDRWDFAEDGYGDCEDYQLVKRRELIKLGFPRRALRMTVVIDETGAGHAVMMVRTDRGEFVLDNKHNSVLPWNQTGYTYIKREDDHGAAWASLGGTVASPVATAGR